MLHPSAGELKPNPDSTNHLVPIEEPCLPEMFWTAAAKLPLTHLAPVRAVDSMDQLP